MKTINNTTQDNQEIETTLEIKLTDATAKEVRQHALSFFEKLGEGAQFLSEAENLDNLLEMHDYSEKEKKMFIMGLKSVLLSAFTKMPKADMVKYSNNKYAKIRFVESIIRLIHLKIIPNTISYYIAPRQIKIKATGEVNYDFKIDLQYQAKIDTLENKGIEILRVDYITSGEWHENLEDISTGEKIINHKPNLIARRENVRSNEPADIVGAYVAYKQNCKVKYFQIDYERIYKAEQAAKKQNSYKTNWGGTGGDGAKKTAVHRLFDLLINKNIEDNEDVSVSEFNETDITPVKKKPTLTTGTDIKPEPIIIENINEVQESVDDISNENEISLQANEGEDQTSNTLI